MLSIAKGVYRGGKGGSAPLELRSFTLFKSEEHKRLVCCLFRAL